MNDIKRHMMATHRSVWQAVETAYNSGWFVLGREVDAFEREFAATCGVAHCIGVANGTDALELGLRSLGVGPGSCVATAANAGLYATIALTALGARPVFVDVDRSTKLIDLARLQELCVQSHPDAIVVTHLYGLMADMDAILSIATAANIPVFEDCAQSVGASRDGRRAGSYGAASSFSFYPTKNLGALGDAGAVLTNDRSIADKVRSLRQYGWSEKYRAMLAGGRNSRLDELQAAALRAKLPFLDGWNQRRREIATRYSQEITNPRIACPPVYGAEFVAHLYVIEADDRADLRIWLEKAGIQTDIHYPIPDHCQAVLNALGPWPPLPITEKLASSILTLPCYAELRNDEVDAVIAAVNAW